MHKKQYEQLAGVVREIDNTLAIAVPLPPQVHSDIMEHVASRIALMLARDSAAFDSFRFYEATGLARFRGAEPLISAELPRR